MEDWQAGGFGLYIHWPFCQSKCPYCDFNSHVAASIDQRRWRDAYLKNIRQWASETKGRVLETVFFGGGTPSLMDPEVVADILDTVRTSWPMVNNPEITLEANPTSVEAGRFAGYREAGVNRVSMGVQSLRDADLRRLGRLHSADEAKEAFDIARNLFDRVSFDLIYARQSQTLADWRAELTEALSMAVDHLSLYQLTIEDGTAFADRFSRGGLKDLPDEEVQADMYSLTQEVCAAHGMPGYEISNHAKPDAESRHNMIYWRMGDYIGIGPGAHGRLTSSGRRWATVEPKAPGLWVNAVEKDEAERTIREEISLSEQALEYLLMSLRLAEGTEISRYERLAGEQLNPDRIDRLMELGLISIFDGRLIASAAGRAVLNSILRELVG
ncbi:radical SAM family heme chaperone HemW [Fuscovulum ytuae]|uniref:Heme chaperone HemW n=1 Tax=Fuscovulum ytuae TaxID=3042299 RepID=A0ABY8Q2Z3_9RHOB|nr:radical SAM family heme chaperone HemW [Fuscovulum sp. YMD61]WGV15193.1 radical SAM family heme chaperone HemW [Fuscovulum sp. YMD61]